MRRRSPRGPQPVVHRCLQNRMYELITAPGRQDVRADQLVGGCSGRRGPKLCQRRGIRERDGAEHCDRGCQVLRILSQGAQACQHPTNDPLWGEAGYARRVIRTPTYPVGDKSGNELSKQEGITTGRSVTGNDEFLLRVVQPVLFNEPSHVSLVQRRWAKPRHIRQGAELDQ